MKRYKRSLKSIKQNRIRSGSIYVRFGALDLVPKGIVNRVMDECSEELANGMKVLYERSVKIGVYGIDWSTQNDRSY